MDEKKFMEQVAGGLGDEVSLGSVGFPSRERLSCPCY